jgi:hypothetical protein
MFNFKSLHTTKTLALLLVLVLFLNAPQYVLAQDSTAGTATDTVALPVQDGKIMFQQIVTLPDSSVNKDRIFLALKEWATATYQGNNFDIDDKEGGKLVLRVSYQSERKRNTALLINYTLSFTVKNGKYRIQVYNLDGKEISYDAFSNKPNPYLPNGIPNDYEKMNDEYITNAKKPFYRRKYSIDILTRTNDVIKSVMASVQSGVAKNLGSGGKSNDNF